VSRGAGDSHDGLSHESARRIDLERRGPQEIDASSLVRERKYRHFQVRPDAEDLARDDDRDGGDEAPSVDDRADAGEAADRAANATLTSERLFYDAAQIAVVRDDHVVLREICALRGARAEPDEARVEDADEVAPKKRATRDRRGEIVGHGDREIDAASGDRFTHGTKLDGAAYEAHVRRLDLEKAEQRWQERFVGGVGQPDPDGAIGRLGIEARRLERGLYDRVEVRSSVGDEARASFREDDAAPVPRHDRFADAGLQATKRSADGGLREVEARRGGGDRAGVGDGDEDGKEVEVEVPCMNGVHESYLYYSLVHPSGDVKLAFMSNSQSKNLGGRFTFPGTSLTVNRMGYGAMQLAGPQVFGPPKDPDAAVAVLKEAVAAGVDHIDTSDFYGPHVTNQLIKRALHPYPTNLVIVTKVGAKRGADASWNRAESPEELRSAVDDNLRNLGLESLDIVNMRVGHLGLGDAPVKAHVEVLLELRKQGKIKHIGLSNVTAKQFAEARAVTEIVCVQNQYNLAYRGDDAFIDRLAKEGVAYVPFFPLGGFSPLQSSTLSDVAKSLEATPMQVALAWLLQRAPNVLLIPGTSSLGHLRENLKAAELQLAPKVVETLNSIAASAPARPAGH